MYFSRQTAGEGLKKKRKRERRSIILICERCGLLNSVSTFYTAAVDTCSASSLCLLMKNKNSNLSVAIYHATRRLFLSSHLRLRRLKRSRNTHLPASQSVSQSAFRLGFLWVWRFHRCLFILLFIFLLVFDCKRQWPPQAAWGKHCVPCVWTGLLPSKCFLGGRKRRLFGEMRSSLIAIVEKTAYMKNVRDAFSPAPPICRGVKLCCHDAAMCLSQTRRGRWDLTVCCNTHHRTHEADTQPHARQPRTNKQASKQRDGKRG